MKNATKAIQATENSRRSLLKMLACGMCAGIVTPLLSFVPSAHAATARAGKAKVLIVYYSRTGNTLEIAKQIQGIAGGDMVEIQTVNPYPEEYRATTKQAQEELKSGYRPPLTTKVENMASYDIVFIGSPNWWGTVATPVMTFLSQYNFSGKTIVPFITHEGSRLGRSVEDIQVLCPNSTVLEGLAVRGGSVKNAQKEVATWLSKLGLAQ